MIRIELSALIAGLNNAAHSALERAANLSVQRGEREVTARHLLFCCLEDPLGDCGRILGLSGIEVERLRQELLQSFPAQVDAVLSAPPTFCPLLLELLQQAWTLATLELGQKEVRTGAILLAALLVPNRYLCSATAAILRPINREALRNEFARAVSTSSEAALPKDVQFDCASAHSTGGDSSLVKYATSVTDSAREGRIDPVSGRDEEIDLMIDILLRRRKNNPIAVGHAGVGKSAVIEGLALRIVKGLVPAALQSVEIWSLDLGALQAGASVKGEFERRLKGVVDEVRSSAPRIILFIDEAHTLIGAGAAAGGSDAANLLKPALARGELRTIAATTWSEYRRYFERDPALSRRFQLVQISEPTIERAVHMLRSVRGFYEKSHGVKISDAALQAAVSLSARYLPGRQLPDKAIDVLDTACARLAASRNCPPREIVAIESSIQQLEMEHQALIRDQADGRKIDPERVVALEAQVTALGQERCDLHTRYLRQQEAVERIQTVRAGEDHQARDDLPEHVATLRRLHRDGPLVYADVGAGQIARVIASWTGVPVATLNADQTERLAGLLDAVTATVRGQHRAVELIHRHLLTAMADLRRPGRPLGAFLLVGPSGVGKTETALRIADHLFGGKQFLTTINMSEYQEKHTVSRLLGAPPGYVGFGEGGVLTEAIRQKPYSIVLLDEVEKAHPEVLNIFYQAFDRGDISDGEGNSVDCSNILFMLTSNLCFDTHETQNGEIDEPGLKAGLRSFFKPALLARMHIVRYQPLSNDVLIEIVEQRLEEVCFRFERRYGAPLHVTDQVRSVLKERCASNPDGARMLDASIDGEVLPPLSLAVLQRMAKALPFRQATLDLQGQAFVAELQ
ncbi:type VI secretion system ATPase TssH [Stenotrophomonas sp. SMYL89]|uniref:type VI secretion system ATPase TssH n=1 Tax=Stenotrophomonas sp. SMYL89 TaxID=3076046 RepID=UPI002E768975|nr:type VI secretion system ATPase TssH [Stenotrophomonas sp. SMYL89]